MSKSSDTSCNGDQSAIEDKLLEIATDYLAIKTFKPQEFDLPDYSERTIWDIHDALLAAYDAGRNSILEKLRK